MKKVSLVIQYKQLRTAAKGSFSLGNENCHREAGDLL